MCISTMSDHQLDKLIDLVLQETGREPDSLIQDIDEIAWEEYMDEERERGDV